MTVHAEQHCREYSSTDSLVGNDVQVNGNTGLGIERIVVSDAVDTGGLGEFLVAERPQIEATVSSKEVELYIKRNQHTSRSPLTSLLGW